MVSPYFEMCMTKKQNVLNQPLQMIEPFFLARDPFSSTYLFIGRFSR
jgi:hypothetical protein